MDEIAQVLEALREMKDDFSVPKNVKLKIDSMITLLEGDCECCIKVDKALHEIEELTEDSNMQSYTRTQIFSVASILETIK